ncbi:type VII secretion integral membrane protein EccD [Streptomyces palmae]|uniref:Type VII secretion integral membrane protein EccD n=1 Tax=Streptomyces palmae TaxID=1701085 RepID=A0A4Z0HAF4_9ACTN|nr:type VII secretion integral membrane protein EccD [Streptomyces palmae]TGB11235.1 type VII secretion integral membrane protein EccD [Streptomyces palmae]
MGESSQRVELSRVTLVGERRRVDLVLPSDEPIGRLLPDILRLLGDRAASQPMLRHLVTAEGAVLAQESTLASAAVRDGAVLRLVREEDTPAAPVVHDVTDEVADDLESRAWRWGALARQWTAGAASVGLAVSAAVLARHDRGAAEVAWPMLGVAVLLSTLGALAARLRSRDLGITLIFAGGALGAVGAWTLADAHGWAGPARLAGVCGAVFVALVLLGLFSPVGRGGIVGAGALAGTLGAWELAFVLQEDAGRVGAALAAVSVVALGVLPRTALTAAGLTSLDDRRSGGASVSRHEVGAALAATHRGLALATMVIAASTMAAGWCALTMPSWWTVLLAAVLVLVLLSRSRAYPLVVEVLALLAGAVVLLVRLVVLWTEEGGGGAYGPVTALAVAAALPLGVLTVRPPEHMRVRLRRLADTVEAVAVLALFPLVVGAFGVYGRLLDVF